MVLEALQGIDGIPKWVELEEERFILMEKVPGISVMDYITAHGKLPYGLIKRLEVVIRECLEHGWVPRDMKTSHVFWDESTKRVHLVDFGQYMELVEYLDERDLSLRMLTKIVLREFRQNAQTSLNLKKNEAAA